MGLAYEYALERQENGWRLVRFPDFPEALTEGETEAEARANARDCLIAAIEGYMKAGRALPRPGSGRAHTDRAAVPSLVAAKMAVYEAMRMRGWSKTRLAKELGLSENSGTAAARPASQFAIAADRRGSGENERGTLHRLAEDAKPEGSRSR